MPEVIDGATGQVEPNPPEGAVPDASQIPLRNATDIRRELARLYREARGGRLDKGEANKLAWLLGELRKAVELEEFEARLAALEARNPNALPAPR
jgi:hypothetical protein